MIENWVKIVEMLFGSFIVVISVYMWRWCTEPIVLKLFIILLFFMGGFFVPSLVCETIANMNGHNPGFMESMGK